MRHLRAEHGEVTVARVLARAREQRSSAVLEDIDTWSRYQQVVDLYAAALEITGDCEIGRRCGERLIQEYAGTGVDTVLRSLGSPGEVLRNVAQAAAKFSVIIRMEAVEVGDDYAIIASGNIPGVPLPKVVCDYTQGVVSQAAPLFGMDTAAVTETQCQAEGAPQCIYHVTWDRASARVNLQRRIDHLEEELAVLTMRFEALMETAANLVSADDIEQLLATILDHAAATVRAPQYVLAVQLRQDDTLHVHQRGVDSERIDATISGVLVDRPDDAGGSRLIVDIVSRARHYGRLAAIYPDAEAGARFLPGEHRLLQAYAAHAAAALDASHARYEAEQRNATARALLDLATSLSQVSTQQDVVECLADAVPSVIGCDSVCVMLWHPDDRVLRVEAARGMPAETEATLRARGMTEQQVPNLTKILRAKQPQFVTYDELDAPVQALFGVPKPVAVAVTPIRHGDEPFGLVGIGARSNANQLCNSPHVRERVQGMADHAATALLNARLVERIRHQALHDGLTELANRLLLQDRAEHAVARARRNGTNVALLFVDLDGFKAVNDQYGHAAGDQLLIEVAQRLQHTARAADTVARLGGDEFALLITDITDEPTVGLIVERIRAELDRPYRIGEQTLHATASIGVAFMEHADNYDSLLHRADLAMYDSKHKRVA